MCAASIAYRLDFGVGGWVMMLSDAIDSASEDDAILIDDESGEWNTAIVDMIYGEGDGLLHELRVADRPIIGPQACS